MAEESIMQLFKTIIIVQLFFSFAITILGHSLPPGLITYVDSFSDLAERIDLEGVSSEVQDSLQRQKDLTIVELGALVFYSGNILIDLLLNFVFAIPEMVGLILTGLMMLLNLDTYMVAILQLFIGVIVVTLYFIGLMQLLAGIRSGRLV